MQKYRFSDAISALSNGEVIVYPTETLYGLGADIFDDYAVTKVFQMKKRPFDMPLSIAVSSIDDLEELAKVTDNAKILADLFLPGSLTMILKKKEKISDIVTGGLENIAVRIPDNKIAFRLAEVFGPITCTSANIHTKQTPSVISEINMLFKDQVSVYLDGGLLEGSPSTIVDLTTDELKIIRPGIITEKMILDAIEHG